MRSLDHRMRSVSDCGRLGIGWSVTRRSKILPADRKRFAPGNLEADGETKTPPCSGTLMCFFQLTRGFS